MEEMARRSKAMHLISNNRKASSKSRINLHEAVFIILISSVIWKQIILRSRGVLGFWGFGVLGFRV